MIPFNTPPYTGDEDQYVLEAMHGKKMSGDGMFTKRCEAWFTDALPCRKALLTPSCTHALEMSALLMNIQPGDEVIMPSYTFVSTANAFVLRGATIVFVDIRPDTMNIDEKLIEDAVTPKTKAIVPVHYAGVACEMDEIMEIARRHSLFVIEDAAQAMMCSYKNVPLGSIGQMGTYSFHDTKNYTSGGEGGLFITKDADIAERADIIREKGTNRSQFLRGMVDKYSWVDIGSSYLPGELQAAYLWGQLENSTRINEDRLKTWALYREGFRELVKEERIDLQFIPDHCQHNAHMFYIKAKDIEERQSLIKELVENEIASAFHYVPLHSSAAGKKLGRFHGEDSYTTQESNRLLRLPIWHGMSEENVSSVIDTVIKFYEG
ncbi:MAG: dTDP-4-amino-4,6-dideoxygalactose transaminase [Micavibrio sp.]|nr:MAG: dTDP-4-amino-4,6-dideoxygalactose transaminase [Micavibrio sp.]